MILCFDLIFHHSTSIWGGVLSLKLKEGIELNRGDKTEEKVWKDANEVVKASIVSEELEEYYILMCDIPKGEKSKY